MDSEPPKHNVAVGEALEHEAAAEEALEHEVAELLKHEAAAAKAKEHEAAAAEALEHEAAEKAPEPVPAEVKEGDGDLLRDRNPSGGGNDAVDFDMEMDSEP